MKRAFWKQCGESLALAGAVLGVGALARGQEAPAPRPGQPIELEVQFQSPQQVLRFTQQKEDAAEKALAERAAASEFWIGVQLAPLDAVALAQLKLKQGVSAVHVFPDSPAQKAGVAQHDVLIKFGDTAINTPEDLVAAVEKNKDQEVELTVFRGGQQTALKIKPIKRPKEGLFELQVAPATGEVRKVETFLRGLGQGGTGGDGLNVYRFRPGVILGEERTKVEYPKDLSITVEKNGNEPAKIKVKRGDKSWDTTPEKLGDLPAEVRPFVEHLLGQVGASSHRLWLESHMKDIVGGGATFSVPVAPPVAMPAPRFDVFGHPPHAVPSGVAKVEVRGFSPGTQNLDEVRKQLQDLLKRVEEMRSAAKAETPLEQMKREVAELRKELDELRKNAAKPEYK